MRTPSPPPPAEEPARLKAKLRVQAAIRLCATKGLMATVARHGDDDAGVILVKQNLLGPGFRVLTQVRDANGDRAWMAGTGADPVEEKAADAYIARQVDRDSDLWVIEIEDAAGWLPFDEKVI
jgi:GMP synthase (glutamine-hydrolysing)